MNPSRYVIQRNGIYHFRIAVPLKLRTHFKKREIKRSLKTTHSNKALVRASILSIKYKQAFASLLENDNHWLSDMGFLDEFQSKSAPNITSHNIEASTTISQASQSHIDEKVRSSQLSLRSIKEYESATELLIEILGDKSIQSVDLKDASLVKSTLLRLPPNRNKSPQYRQKSISELIAMELDSTQIMGIETINGFLTRISTLFRWAKANGITNINPFEGLNIRSKRKAREARAAFTRQDLSALFSAINHPQKEPLKTYQKWVPLIALYSGARLNEICQLRRSDVAKINGIWCFMFTSEDSMQSSKTESSKRVVPVHSKLIELGLIKHMEAQQETKQLFPELKYQRDGYGTIASKWFARIRSKLNWINSNPKRDFHSFRHTVANELKQKGVHSEIAGGILGHSTGTITYDRYGKAYTPLAIQSALELLNWDDVVDQIL